MKIKAKGKLTDVIRNESYDKIVVWADGTWACVSSGYAGEISGEQPVYSISRASHYDLRYKDIYNVIKEIENYITAEVRG